MKPVLRVTTTFLAGLALAFQPSARADLVVQPGETFVGEGTINENVVNNGAIIGAPQPLVFAAGTLVTGAGSLENTRIDGTYAPGNSPSAVSTTNIIFTASSTAEFELGGTIPGFGAGRHDQINDTATITLQGGVLKVSPFGGFVPQSGDQFVIMTWQTQLSGAFGSMMVDPFFTSQGINFTQQINNPGGPGNFTLIAIPEASSILLIGVIGGGWVVVRRAMTSLKLF
jgi:hypothetical protein